MTDQPLAEYCERCGRQLLGRVVPTGWYSRLSGVAQTEAVHLCPRRAKPSWYSGGPHDYHKASSAICVGASPVRPVSPKPPDRPDPSKAEEISTAIARTFRKP